jgi:hypothetical protein
MAQPAPSSHQRPIHEDELKDFPEILPADPRDWVSQQTSNLPAMPSWWLRTPGGSRYRDPALKRTGSRAVSELIRQPFLPPHRPHHRQYHEEHQQAVGGDFLKLRCSRWPGKRAQD